MPPIDVTTDPEPAPGGHLHPSSIVLAEVADVLGAYGFDGVDGPEVESVEYNFDRLDVPADHPMRDRRRSFWVGSRHLLRSQTSAGVARALAAVGPGEPLRAWIAGPCYRNEPRSTRSARQFVQMDVVLAGPDVRPVHFRSLVTLVLGRLLGEGRPLRWRPHLAPDGPLAWAVDAACSCVATSVPPADCPLCGGRTWLEIVSGSVLPDEILRLAGHDPSTYRALSFGASLDRVVLLRWGVPDIGALLGGDVAVVAALGRR